MQARKRLIADSSSLILLTKAGLLKPLLDTFQVIVPPLVYEEMTRKDQPDGRLLRTCLQEGLYQIQTPSVLNHNAHGLKGGDREVFILHQELGGTILTDDGRLAALCRRQRLPYLNALTAAVDIWRYHHIDFSTLYQALLRLIQLGRYSDWVVAYVEKLINVKLERSS